MSDADTNLPTFRAPKRRKTAQQPRPIRQSTSHSPSTLNSNSNSEDDQRVTTSFIKPRVPTRGKARSNGMQFSNVGLRGQSGGGGVSMSRDEGVMVNVSSAGTGESVSVTGTHGLGDRFVGSGMGGGRDVQGGGNDPNITAYIDAEMARRRQVQLNPTPPSPSRHPQLLQESQDPQSINAATTTTTTILTSTQDSPKTPQPPSYPLKHPQPQPSTTHAPSEIDLSSHPLPTPTTIHPRKRKPKQRLDRTGKPLPPRPRPRRGPNEEDVARAALVEQVLSEGTVLYGASAGGEADGGPGIGMSIHGKSKGVDEDADEKMEREFRASFMERGGAATGGDARGNGGTNGKGANEKKEGVVSGGPRLGGSRAARARMVAALEGEKVREAAGK